ncbi:oxidoreductase [Vibrio sp. MACH09]|uniref:FAD-dependent oxidoreductase n=1 Tax=Vibrio sp. MACH09 TaxID=3025122 RepID=UPI00278ED769|nr:FAD-dependent oxidoreductase [Vibrio sp. MACH09]GLO63262.1 oxidoreductase [Vibrio sp. MACH09]
MKHNSAPHIGVIGGGIAGSTTALHLCEQGFKVTLIERGAGLVSGPPICHLHAGGNLYREISQQQCLDLLKQSIDTVRLYPHALNIRPTVIATPTTDVGEPQALLPRLIAIQAAYRDLVELDESNAVLGNPDDYYRLFDRDELEALAQQTQLKHPETISEWLIPFAKHVALDKIKYPVVVVQEFGLSVFRLAASATLTLQSHPKCQLFTGCLLQGAEFHGSGWNLNYVDDSSHYHSLEVDYLVNACGYRSGTIDDVTRQPQKRLVEFKSAFVTRWPESQMHWPEVIFHGERGTPDGMAQLTPYPDGYFQLHGMTEEITLFKQGLSSSNENSSQPKLANELEQKMRVGWPEGAQKERTSRAIEHLSRFVPMFCSAIEAGKPLYGAQQIPGSDPSLRAVDVSFTDKRYARVEIVKASSAYQAATKIAKAVSQLGRNDQSFVTEQSPIKEQSLTTEQSIEQKHPNHLNLGLAEVERKAVQLANQRGYPEALAKVPN